MSARPVALAGPPPADEYPPPFAAYVSRVTESDFLEALAAQHASGLAFLRSIPESRAGHRYAEGKWSVAEVIGHVADSERVFTYRALTFARGDGAPLPGFDENAWLPEAGFAAVPLADLIAGYDAVRRATLSLFSTMRPEAFLRRGTANGRGMSVRALGYVAVGHERHHWAVLKERYGV